MRRSAARSITSPARATPSARDLVGPQNPLLKEPEDLKLPFSVTIKDQDRAVLKIDGAKYELRKDVYTDWIPVRFRVAPGMKVSGLCKFLLLSTEPEFGLYVTPINIDPEHPAMPVGYPSVYSVYLAKKQGPFATLGLAEDTWALNEHVINDDQFIQQCLDMDREREEMFFDAIDKVPRGLIACVFDGTDRLQHTFWRDIDEQHPARPDQDVLDSAQRHRGPLPPHGRPRGQDDGQMPGQGHAAHGHLRPRVRPVPHGEST